MTDQGSPHQQVSLKISASDGRMQMQCLMYQDAEIDYLMMLEHLSKCLAAHS